MKINFILPSVFKSGGVTSIYEYGNRLTELGHDVCVYYPIFPLDSYRNEFSFRRIVKYLKFLKYHLKNLLSKNFYNHKFEIKIVPVLNNCFISSADFLIATTWHTAYIVKKLNVSKGIKIYFIQGYEIWDSNLKLVDGSYLLGLNCITISLFLKELFQTKFNLETKLIYNGFDKKKFYFQNTEKDFVLRKILFIDYSSVEKNVKMLIEQIEKIKTKYPGLEVLSFGYDNHTPKPKYIKFYKNPSEHVIRKLYNEADLFIFPSMLEGFGNPPVEAMACKCAVASTLVGGVPEYIVNNETGFILKNDLSNIIDVVDYVINDWEKLRRISENGYKKINYFLDWNLPTTQLVNYLNCLKLNSKF